MLYIYYIITLLSLSLKYFELKTQGYNTEQEKPGALLILYLYLKSAPLS